MANHNDSCEANQMDNTNNQAAIAACQRQCQTECRSQLRRTGTSSTPA